jgi:hypothetical protein
MTKITELKLQIFQIQGSAPQSPTRAALDNRTPKFYLITRRMARETLRILKEECSMKTNSKVNNLLIRYRKINENILLI